MGVTEIHVYLKTRAQYMDVYQEPMEKYPLLESVAAVLPVE